MSMSIPVNDHGLSKLLEQFGGKVQKPSALAKVLGRRGSNELKLHFRNRDRIPNRLGGERTHFWRQVADSVQNPVIEGDGARVRISINHPAFAQRLLGGVIRAKRGKMLTIPQAPEAHGRTAKTLEHETGLRLFLYVSHVSGFAALAARIGPQLRIFYILKPSVRQEPDPYALPMRNIFDTALMAEARDFTDRDLLRRLKTQQ